MESQRKRPLAGLANSASSTGSTGSASSSNGAAGPGRPDAAGGSHGDAEADDHYAAPHSAAKRPNRGPSLSSLPSLPLNGGGLGNTARHAVLEAGAASAEPDPAHDPKSFEGVVLAYQKKAIWLQMEEYRRQHDAALGDLAVLDSQMASLESALGAIVVVTDSVYATLDSVAGQQPATNDMQVDASSDLSSSLVHLFSSLNPIPTTNPSPSSSTAPSTSSAHAMFLSNFKERWTAIGNLVSIISRVVSNGSLSPDVDKALARSQKLSAEASQLQTQIAQHQHRIQTLEAKLSTATETLLSTQKKLDRLRMQPHAEVPGGSANASGSAGPGEAGAETANGAGANAGSASAVKADGTSGATVAEELYRDAAHQAELRLAEIQNLTKERAALQVEMNSMRLELEEARTKDARLADLDRQLRHEMTQHDLTRGELERVLLENQSLHGDRRSFIEQVRIAEAKERKSLEAELRKLEVDLQRLRSARDALQKSLEERMSRDEVEMRHVQEMRQLAQTRKDRMMTLEADLQRLKMCVAANMGETSLIEFFDEAPDTSPYKVLRERLSQAETRINQFEELMTSLQSEDPTAQLAAQIDQQASVERQLRKEIDDFVRLLGSSNPDLVARLEDQDRQIAELRAKVDYSQKTETRLLNEIETIGKAWAELEEQTSKKVFNLADKEEHIMRLLAEKAKYEQKFGLLSKQSATFNNLGIALRRQSDKQLEQIRKQEELEKNLTQQLQVLEKEAAAKAPMLEKERRRVAELTVQAAQQKDKADRTALRCDQLAAMLKTKTEAVEQEAEAKRRLQEQVDMLKRKLDAYGSRDSPADSVLKKQLEEYKLLLKCQSCNNRFKSHVLNKCMHTFCKECIDDMYNSRQRKCPACGVAFSQQDIRQVYL